MDEQEDVAVEFFGFGNAAIVEQGVNLLRGEQGESILGSRGASNFSARIIHIPSPLNSGQAIHAGQKG